MKITYWPIRVIAGQYGVITGTCTAYEFGNTICKNKNILCLCQNTLYMSVIHGSQANILYPKLFTY